MKSIVIIGGGFGGVKTALELLKEPKINVTLISDKTEFHIYSTLYRVATGGNMGIAKLSLTKIFADHTIKLVTAKITKLDRNNKTIATDSGQTFAFDELVCALGSATDYFGIKGVDDFSYSVSSPKQAQHLKEHLHRQLLDTHEQDTHYIVVGGGPTGVELAGSLPRYLRAIYQHHHLPVKKIKVTLLEASKRVLPTMPRDVSFIVKRHLKKEGVRVRTNQQVQSQTIDTLRVGDKTLESQTVIWTAGATLNPFFIENTFQLATNKKVRVNQYLQAEPNIYVIGDNADTPYSGMAQTAIHDGKFVAQNFIKQVNKQGPSTYRAKKPIYVTPAGPRWAAVVWGKFRMYGRLGWWLRRIADFIAYRDYEPWHEARKQWLLELEKQDSCNICQQQ